MTRPVHIAIAASLAALLSVGIAYVRAESVPYQGQNTGRFQMFFAPMARADHFMVDTADGSVWQRVVDSKGEQLFEPVSVIPAPVATTQTIGRFRIYYGAHARADLYLLDTATGRSWQWVTDPEKNDRWFSGVNFARPSGS